MRYKEYLLNQTSKLQTRLKQLEYYLSRDTNPKSIKDNITEIYDIIDTIQSTISK